MSANPWFRMYHEFATDPKVQMLSEQDQRRYVMLLCLRCSNEGETLHDDAVAFQLRISNEEYQATKQTLMSKNLIDEGNNPTAWDKRQFASDSSTARVRAYREKQKKEAKQPRNVSVTPPESDTESESEGNNAPAKIEYQKIADLYNEICTDQPSVRSVTPERQRHIRARINDDAKRQSLSWWETYFTVVSSCPHLIGKTPPKDPGGKPWVADFDWLINPNNMAKVLEGKYDAR